MRECEFAAARVSWYVFAVNVLDVLSATSGKSRWFIPSTTVLGLALLVLGCGLLYHRSLRSTVTVPGIILGQTTLGAVPFDELDRVIQKEAQRQLRSSITLEAGPHSIRVTRKELGARVDSMETRLRLQQTGKSGHLVQDLLERVSARRGKLTVPLVMDLDRDVALDYFIRIKNEIDKDPVPLRLDLDRQVVRPGSDGYTLHVYDSLAATELALRRNSTVVKLAVGVIQPGGRSKGLAKLDIGHVLGKFSTVYSLKDKDKDRAHNLKVGASKLDGTILKPGETFSFNTVVGKRTEEEGYRTAPVITEGELIDGMAGGACQLSSTLFAASFFAGLELVSSRPHTMPSSYVKMGLDAAVAYPAVDLVLKNPYPFPVVIHFAVSSGRVKVRILGKKRPWRRVVFERALIEEIPFETQTRKDSTIPKGQQVVGQRGVPGFKLERRRLLFGEGKEPQKVEKRELKYPPTVQIIREGTGPADPEWKPPPPKEPFGKVKSEYSMEQ